MSIAIDRIPGKGRGVIAERAFCAGETIERPPVIVIPQDEAPLIRDTLTFLYDKQKALQALNVFEQSIGGSPDERLARKTASWRAAAAASRNTC